MECPFCREELLMTDDSVCDAAPMFGRVVSYTCKCGASVIGNISAFVLGVELGRALHHDKKIQAIRAWRRLTGHSLRMSKDVIEGILSVL